MSQLTGVISNDLPLMRDSDIIIATPENWDIMSKNWRKRNQVRSVTCYIFDELQLLEESGCNYEIIASRVSYMQKEIKTHAIRIVALSTSLANGKDVAQWLGISFPGNTFNFPVSIRPMPLDIHIQTFDHNHKDTRVLAMGKPTFN